MIRGLLVVGTLLSLITLASRLASKHLVLDANSEQWSATVKTCHEFDSWT